MKKSLLLITALMVPLFMWAQREVSGTVSLKDTGEPEIGVNVVVTGTSTGTITDFDGNYTITVPEGKTLTFSYLGYSSQTLAVTSSQLDVVLSPDEQVLDEVVAVGYGTMRKSDLTGSVASVKSEDLQSRPAASLSQALQGKAAGVTVNAVSGQPGAAAEVRIRGIGTVNNSSPIYVVDGMIVDDISFLSTDDIASTEILKDASATAIYGSRGANGVVLITTKRGKKGEANITFNAYAGFQNSWRKLDLMGRDDFSSTLVAMQRPSSEEQYQDYHNYGFDYWLKAYKLGNSQYFPTNFNYGEQETDWQNEVFNQNAPIQNYHLAIDGATDKGSYAMSVSYFNQEGTIKGSDYERLTVRLNSDFKPREWLRIGEDFSFMYSGGRNASVNNASPQASILSASLAMAPWDPTHYPDGSINKKGADISGNIAAGSNNPEVVNPYTMLEKYHPEDKADRWVGNVFVELLPVKGLSIKSTINMDLSNVRHKMFKEKYEFSAKDQSQFNFLESSTTRYLTLIQDNIISYSTDIGKHAINVMAGQTWQEYTMQSLGGSGFDIVNPAENKWYLSQTTMSKEIDGVDVSRKVSDGAERTAMVSFLARAHYAYDHRYMVTATFRADGTSKFKNSDPWGYFPSVALAWNANEEWFLKQYDKLDYFKVRAGWGQVGNEKVSQSAFASTIFTEGPTFVGYVAGDGNQQILNGASVLKQATDGRWETTEQWNVGVDFGFWNGMLSGTVEGFVRDTKDMIMVVTTPGVVGNVHYPSANVGLVRNAGAELSLEHRNMVGDFSYSISGNVSYVKNTLLKKNSGDTMYGDRTIIEEGLPLNTFYMYEYLGVYKSDAEAAAHLPNESVLKHAGDAKYTDVNNDGKIDENDKKTFGSPFPWLTYALTFQAEFYGVDLSVMFQGAYGNQVYNAVRERTEGQGMDCTLSNTMKDVWTVDNQNGSIPNPYGDAENMASSTRFLEDGSYFRIKDVQIGYTLPRRITQKAKINRLRFYASASNLLTLTKYTGYDPEVGLGGVDYGNYPVPTTFLFGLNLAF